MDQIFGMMLRHNPMIRLDILILNNERGRPWKTYRLGRSKLIGRGQSKAVDIQRGG